VVQAREGVSKKTKSGGGKTSHKGHALGEMILSSTNVQTSLRDFFVYSTR